MRTGLRPTPAVHCEAFAKVNIAGRLALLVPQALAVAIVMLLGAQAHETTMKI